MTILKKSVTLNPGESKTVAFSLIPSVDGFYSVSVDGLSGNFTVLPIDEAEFEVSNLIIEPTEVYVGEPVSITCTVTNTGGKTGTYEVTCEVL